MNITPELLKPNFQCLYCKITTQHEWRELTSKELQGSIHYTSLEGLDNFKISICYSCDRIAMWHNDKIIFPNTTHQPPAHAEMPDLVKQIYNEAASISQLSPRASCALMRCAVEALVINVGYKGSLFESIGQMYKEGLIDDAIKDSLDIVRLTGNDSVHGNQIDMNEETDIDYMFILINEIVESISSRKRRKDMLEKFGESRLDSIKKRDSK